MSPARVLIVDDNPMSIAIAETILIAERFSVQTAADSMQAMHQVTAFRPDLILMDIQMPGMDGLTLTQQLKADPRTAGIAIIAFTAYAMHGDEARLRGAGCDGYISKPIDVARFVGQVLAFAPIARVHGHG